MAEIDNLVIRLETDDRATAGLNSLLATLQRIKSISGVTSAAYSGITSNINVFNTAVRQNVTQIQQQATSISRSVTQINNMGTAAQRNASRLNTLRSALNFSGAYIVLRRVSRYLAEAIQSSNEYVENLNLFNVAMGEYAGEALEYANQVKNALGIDPSEWIRAQGTFNILLTGFGVANEKASLMSKTMTQLGYDLASLYNSDVSTAMTKLQSGLAGELEPLRRWGYDLSQARLQEEALALGISKKVTEMNQAEKSMLRYHAIMTQVTEAHGDMARTLNSPANQLRIFRSQLNMLSRAFGNVFIPVLNRTLPYLIAFVELLREAVEKIALFFGFELPEVDYSGMSSATSAVSDNLEDASESVKKIKRDLMGFDEINRLSDQSGKSAGSTVNNGVGFDIEIPTYDFITEELNKKTQEAKEIVREKMREIMLAVSPFIAAIGLILISTGANIPLGIGMVLAGAFMFGVSAFSQSGSISSSVASTLSTIMGIVGGFMVALGVILIVAGNLPWGIGLLLAGVVSIAAAVTINYKFSEDRVKGILTTITGIVSGASLALGILLIITGVNIPLGIALVAIGAVSVAAAVAVNWNSMSDSTKSVLQNIALIAGASFLAVGIILAITGVGLPIAIALIAAGAASITAGAAINWDLCKSKIKSALGLIGGIVSTASMALGAILLLSGVGFGIGLALILAGASGLRAAENWDDTGILTKIKQTINKIIESVERGINTCIDKLNGILSVEIAGKVIGPQIRHVSIPRLASGGQVDEGQLFIARERGPELVGSMNGRTTVANNEQIVEGIYRGVYAAMKDSNNGNGGFISKVVIMLDSEQVGEAVVDWHNGVVKQTGNSPLLV